MAGGVNEPTILVKKADGTSVRMSLSEIKKMKEAKTVEVKKIVAVDPVTVIEKSVSPEKLSGGSHPSGDHLPVASTPLAIAHSAQDDSLSSRHSSSVIPSETERSEVKSRDPLAVRKPITKEPIQARPSSEASNYDDSVKKIIKESGVNIPLELSSRANSLLISRLKGIRDDDQFLAYASKLGANGGLSLNQAQAERILNFTKEYLKKNTVKIVKPGSMLAPKQSYRRPAAMLPMKNTFSHELSTTTPVTDIFLDEAKALSKKINTSPIQSVKPSIKEIIKLPADYDFVRTMTAKSTQKKGELIQDISQEQKPEEEKFTGPADEMKKFNLRDWRRLAHKPTECAEIILNKFNGWKDESYMLYMGCRQALSLSPLLTEYRNILLQSINTATTVQNIIKNLHNKDSLVYEEFLEVGRLNAKLEM